MQFCHFQVAPFVALACEHHHRPTQGRLVLTGRGRSTCCSLMSAFLRQGEALERARWCAGVARAWWLFCCMPAMRTTAGRHTRVACLWPGLTTERLRRPWCCSTRTGPGNVLLGVPARSLYPLPLEHTGALTQRPDSGASKTALRPPEHVFVCASEHAMCFLLLRACRPHVFAGRG